MVAAGTLGWNIKMSEDADALGWFKLSMIHQPSEAKDWEREMEREENNKLASYE